MKSKKEIGIKIVELLKVERNRIMHDMRVPLPHACILAQVEILEWALSESEEL